MTRHVAIDLGASGGRVALGTLEDGLMDVAVLHRFQNHAIELPTGLYWDVFALWREILHGLKLAGEQGEVATVGVNTWGVDYALLDANDLLIDGVHHYRDPRTEGAMQEVFRTIPRDHIYGFTGIQFMPLNTIFQLVRHGQRAPGIFTQARSLLMLPDLLHFWLCGVKASERTIASTSQLYDPNSRSWSETLIARCGIPTTLFQDLVDPGEILGDLRPEIGLKGTKVIAPCAHDTASAVAAVPASGDGWAYVSCGTWALVGVELPQPIITDETLECNLTNEAGIKGTTRLLKNIVGLWILQECRRAWGDPPYSELYAAAADVSAGALRIDPDDPSFMAPGIDMPDRVSRVIGSSDRAVITRCILDSLAAKTASVLNELEKVTGQSLDVVHVVGGGSQVDLLNQLIANASQKLVISGPVEATLYGNLVVQAEAIGSIPEGSIRDVVKRSLNLSHFRPA